MSMVVLAGLGLALSGCGGDPAEQKAFDTCRAASESRYPSTCPSGSLCVDVAQIKGFGNSMESCMLEQNYKYDETKSGCKLPEEWNANFYLLKSNAGCYSAPSAK